MVKIFLLLIGYVNYSLSICLTGSGVCKWRATQGCKFDGPRDSENDKKCDFKIPRNVSGSCKCSDGRIMNKQGCDWGDYVTCKDACIGKFVPRIQFFAVGYNFTKISHV